MKQSVNKASEIATVASGDLAMTPTRSGCADSGKTCEVNPDGIPTLRDAEEIGIGANLDSRIKGRVA